MTAEQQTAAIKSIAGDKPLDDLLKASVNGPFVMKISPIGDLPDQGHIQQIDLWFVAEGTLAKVEDKKLLDELASPKKQKKEQDIPEEARALTEAELASRQLTAGEQPDKSTLGYGLLKANILSKVYLQAITKTQASKSPESIISALIVDPKLALDAQFPGQWSPLVEDQNGNESIGKPSPYSAAGAYAKATPIKGVSNRLFIEIHIVFAEPHAWFEGRNMLRSKLPPLLQDTVRTFRRKLAG